MIGEGKSRDADDAVIEATLSDYRICGSEEGTVFWYDSGNLRMTREGAYGMDGQDFTAVDPGPPAVFYVYWAGITPGGIDYTADQIANLRVAGLLIDGVQSTISQMHV